MSTKCVRRCLLFSFIVLAGCGTLRHLAHDECGNCKHRDKPVVNSRAIHCGEPILEAAACVTQLEDELRRDGSITVKTPDVWGDRNLMHWIQEFDQQLTSRVGDYDVTIQAIQATADLATVVSQTQAGVQPGGTSPELPETELLDLGNSVPLAALDTLKKLLSSEEKFTLEPTERIRQEATYVYVNQALRRKNMGGDNTRQAGYGLYLFRIPVSVLPGAETSQGYAAIANLRARMVVTPADVKFTLPRMAVADLVENLAPFLTANWKANPTTSKEDIQKLEKWLSDVREKTAKATFSTENKDAICLLVDKTLENVNCLKVIRDVPNAELDVERRAINELASKVDNEFKKAEAARMASVASRAKQMNDILKDVAQNTDPEQRQVLAQSLVRSFEYDENTPTHFKTLLSNVKPGKLDETILSPLFAEANNYAQFTAALAAYDQEVQALSNQLPPIAMTFEATPVSIPLSFGPQDQATLATGIPQLAVLALEDELVQVLRHIKSRYQGRLGSDPTSHEIRHALFNELLSITNHLDSTNIITDNIAIIESAALEIERGKPTAVVRETWISNYKLLTQRGDGDEAYLTTTWLVAQQYGLVDLNIKRMLDEMVLNGQVDRAEAECARAINFFSKQNIDEAARLWGQIVESEFPLQVFTLEPEVEEQNVVDAVSRIREMQLALAISVAKGAVNTAQRVNLARRLTRDVAAIGLNRTIVGFIHGADTFGWYFYPRVQPPAIEGSNLRVFAKTCLTGGPTAAEDIKSRRLEPGIRECEVLIAMPSFVQQVEFDVTTNWESLACPGQSKRSYQEMIAQGAQWQKIRNCMETASCNDGYRPRDLAALSSRVDQLENMLGMQTYQVNVPFAFEQTGNDLFDTGDRFLVPEVHGSYGLRTLAVNKPEGDKPVKNVIAEFFLSGRNFHPTQTHVIVSGHEAHTADTDASKGIAPGVEILSRELLRVRVELKEHQLVDDRFEVRVGTPNGLSNPVWIKKYAATQAAAAKSDFDWELPPEFSTCRCCNDGHIEFAYENKNRMFRIQKSSTSSNSMEDVLKNGHKVTMAFSFDIEFDDKSKKSLGRTRFIDIRSADVTEAELWVQIEAKLKDGLADCGDPAAATITGTTYLQIDSWPLITFDKKIKILLRPQTTPKCTCDTNPSLEKSGESIGVTPPAETLDGSSWYFQPSSVDLPGAYTALSSISNLDRMSR